VIDHAPGLDRVLGRVPDEHRGPARAIEGDLPAFLRGTLYLNGPGRFERGGVRFGHWLDGDGMVCALRLGADGAEVTNRWVRSTRWRAEEEAGRPLFRTFGTGFPGDRLGRGGVALESPVNVSIVPFAGRLLAFGEQGLPWELDPVTLETLGEHTFGGRLGPVAPLAAHPKVDPRTGEMIAFGVSFAASAPQLHVYRFGADGNLIYRKRLRLEHPCSVHDFAVSERHAVFHLSPYLLDISVLADGGTILDALSWRPELGGVLRVVARENGEEVAAVPLERGYSLHTVNAFEDGEGRLVVDLIELDRPVYGDYRLPGLFAEVGEGRPVRLIVDLARGQSTQIVERREIPYRLAPDFPAIEPERAGRSCDDFWMLGLSATGRPGRKFFDQLVHARWSGGDPDVWQAPAGLHPAGEPAFVADPEHPEGGAVLCPLFDTAREETAFAVFDARHVAAGPRATIWTGTLLPLAFHAAFVGSE
jgi:carotenoid cleavage dioxygenase-like enzyme